MASPSSLDQSLLDMYASVFSDKTSMAGYQATEVIRGIQMMQETIALKRRQPKQHKVILAYTSNMISSGLRECIAALIAAGVVDAVVTTAGGIEEDLIKCLGPTLIGDFALDGSALRDKGLNRIGNLLVPNNNYVLFESFFRTVLHRHRSAQKKGDVKCSPTTTAPCDFLRSAGECLESIEQLAAERKEKKLNEETSSSVSSRIVGADDDDGEEGDAFTEHLADIDIDELRRQRKQSVAYQCWKHNVPILCPGFTDGSMGDMTFFFNVNLPGMVIDSGRDALVLEDEVLGGEEVRSAAVIAVGGGLPKHFALRAVANRQKEEESSRSPQQQKLQLTHAVLITTTAPGVDGSVSAGTPQDEMSQGLLSSQDSAASSFVHVRVEATLCFPFMCAMSLFSPQ